MNEIIRRIILKGYTVEFHETEDHLLEIKLEPNRFVRSGGCMHFRVVDSNDKFEDVLTSMYLKLV